MSEANVRTATEELANRQDGEIPFRCRLGWHCWGRWQIYDVNRNAGMPGYRWGQRRECLHCRWQQDTAVRT